MRETLRPLMSSQHKHTPISLRLPEDDRAWLLQYARLTGKPVNKILAEALAAYRAPRDPELAAAGD